MLPLREKYIHYVICFPKLYNLIYNNFYKTHNLEVFKMCKLGAPSCIQIFIFIFRVFFVRNLDIQLTKNMTKEVATFYIARLL